MRNTLESIPTPAAVVDLERLEANLGRMQDYATEHDLRLRPHIKTHKARWLGEEQARLGAVGLTVATAVEADLMAGAAPELLVAYPALGPRAGAIARVAAATPTLVALDSVKAVETLRAAMEAEGGDASVGVLVEVDVGMRRTGVSDAAAAVEVARACGDRVVYRGIMFYPGHIREPVDEQDDQLEALGERLTEVVDALGGADLAPEIVSGGSTPTAFRSHEIPHQTEIRPGTYVFNDRTTAGIGACEREQVAYTVLATVISTAVPGQAVVDAGSKALSSDPIRAPELDGYGEMLDRPEVTVTRLSEEHGILDLSRTDWRPKVGDRVRLVPNHVCVSVNLHPVIHGVRGWSVERTWGPEARGWTVEGMG